MPVAEPAPSGNGSLDDKSRYDELPDGVVVAGPDGRVVQLNPSAARLLGVSVDSALGRDYREVLALVDEQDRDW